MKKSYAWRFSVVFAATAVMCCLQACNIFSPFDNPSGDAQDISKARACLDAGNFSCAMTYYQELSSSSSDTANSEEAFTTLDQDGSSMGNFFSAFGSAVSAAGLNALTASIAATGGAGESKRMDMYTNAFLKYPSVQNTSLQGMVEFVSSLAIASEILAEWGTGGQIHKSDLVVNPTLCMTSGCIPSSNCTPAGSIAAGSPAHDEILTNAPNTSPPTLEQFNSALIHANAGLNLMSAGGSFGQTGQSFGAVSAGDPATVTASCYLYALLLQGVGI